MKQSGKREDELDAILGRFQRWSKAQSGASRAQSFLDEDMQEISYEQALRAAGRFRMSMPEERCMPEANFSSPLSDSDMRAGAEKDESFEAVLARETVIRRKETVARAQPAVKAPRTYLQPQKVETPSPNGNRRRALSVKMNGDEAAVIRSRAEEAGLSVSAYLRSCALEVDNLREQVQFAVAELQQTRKMLIAPATSAYSTSIFAAQSQPRTGLVRRVLQAILGIPQP